MRSEHLDNAHTSTVEEVLGKKKSMVGVINFIKAIGMERDI